jgi:hypothetical protein
MEEARKSADIEYCSEQKELRSDLRNLNNMSHGQNLPQHKVMLGLLSSNSLKIKTQTVDERLHQGDAQ